MAGDADSKRWTRRQWLAGSSAASVSVLLAGCAGGRPQPSFSGQPDAAASGAPPPSPGADTSAAESAETTSATPAARAPIPAGSPPGRFAWREDEQALLAMARGDFDIVERGGANAAVLRSWARPVPPGLGLSQVAARMQRTMEAAKGVGLAAPQVGLRLRVATLKLNYQTDHPRTLFVRNPTIVERSDETIEGYEMCLSIPGIGGLVRRNKWIKVAHTTAAGEVLSAEAEDHNAVLWQHEIEHLDGVLYVDKVLGELLPADEVRRRRKQRDRDASAPRSTGHWELNAQRVGAFALTDYAEGASLLRVTPG